MRTAPHGDCALCGIRAEQDPRFGPCSAVVRMEEYPMACARSAHRGFSPKFVVLFTIRPPRGKMRRRVHGTRKLRLVDAWHDSSLAGGMLATPQRNVLSPGEGQDGDASLKTLGDARILLLQRLKKRMRGQRGGHRGIGVQGCGCLTGIRGMAYSGGGHSCWLISFGKQ